ncbi:hypothetical protein QIG60_26865, partial [Klebsiella pneumoniae]|nr:hypothetical protein [Klebsiella pneumoniae]
AGSHFDMHGEDRSLAAFAELGHCHIQNLSHIIAYQSLNGLKNSSDSQPGLSFCHQRSGLLVCDACQRLYRFTI